MRHKVLLVLHTWVVADDLAAEDTGHAAVEDIVLEADTALGEERHRVADMDCALEVDNLAAGDRDHVLVEEVAGDKDYGFAEGAAGSHVAGAAGHIDLEGGSLEVVHSLEEDPVEVGRSLVAVDNPD